MYKLKFKCTNKIEKVLLIYRYNSHNLHNHVMEAQLFELIASKRMSAYAFKEQQGKKITTFSSQQLIAIS